jgi:hypothetical protein
MKLRLRYRLRTFLVVIGFACLFLGIRANRASRYHRVVDPIHSVYSEVVFDETVATQWLQFILGPDVASIVEVRIPGSDGSLAVLDALKAIPNLKTLRHSHWWQAHLNRLEVELPNASFERYRYFPSMDFDAFRRPVIHDRKAESPSAWCGAQWCNTTDRNSTSCCILRHNGTRQPGTDNDAEHT